MTFKEHTDKFQHQESAETRIQKCLFCISGVTTLLTNFQGI